MLAGGLDHVDPHRLGNGAALVEEHQLERQLLAAPERLLGPVADVAIGVVVELAQLGRHVDDRRLVRPGGQAARAGADVVEAERRRGRRHAQAGRRRAIGRKRRSGRTVIVFLAAGSGRSGPRRRSGTATLAHGGDSGGIQPAWRSPKKNRPTGAVGRSKREARRRGAGVGSGRIRRACDRRTARPRSSP